MLTPEKIDYELQLVKDLLIRKNADYGSAGFDLGQNGTMVLLYVKIQRYRNLIEKSNKGEQIHFESISDTLSDIIGYAVMAKMMLKEELRNLTMDKIESIQP